MEIVDEVSSECEFVSENEVTTNDKGKKKKTSNPKKVKKPPRAPSASDSPSIHVRKRKSIWWGHFQDTGIPDLAECIHCQRRIGCATVYGTSPLKNHVLSCKKYQPNIDKKQKLIDLESKTHASDDGSVETVTILKLWEFNQDIIRKALVKMLIVDELPFSFVEREGFREFMKVVNPHFLIPSRSTSTNDCYACFIDERRKLTDIFKNLSSRVCLTTDTWTSGQNLCYMCLTAHFIDNDWRLHKRIINFCPIIGHTGTNWQIC